jgi:proline dehydrogenase
MLYGIRRDLQHRLHEEGYNVRIYLPYGESWYPYLIRRVAERPANLMFIASSLAREAPLNGGGHGMAIGAGVLAGVLATMAWRRR